MVLSVDAVCLSLVDNTSLVDQIVSVFEGDDLLLFVGVRLGGRACIWHALLAADVCACIFYHVLRKIGHRAEVLLQRLARQSVCLSASTRLLLIEVLIAFLACHL